ncbi:hypothetical protein LSH36_1717g00002 [Paralvinella palmiformis]|uniref:Uncharacterized protein n=1 Tax=Paralvinella palmiformis TaxID=53620 RepID=A0AAD9MQ25_9ANNE|nr:hypothetical protein LSH36_1717g00002 [Paralvinella palmiformis]
MFLQETHDTVEVESMWKHEWVGEIIFSRGTSISKGEAILLPLNFEYKIETLIKRSDGTYIIAKIECYRSKHVLTNVYTPTQDEENEQIRVIDTLQDKLANFEGPDSRHRERWKRAIIRRTAEQEGKHDFKQAILDVCNHRNDAQARDVRIRIQGAISDMQAADAIYHKECYTLFIASRTISAAVNKSSCSSNKSGVSDTAFQMVVDVIGWKPSHIWNSVDVYNLYSHKGSCLLRRPLTTKLTQRFGNDLLVLSGSVVANLLVFRSKASSVLRLVDDDEDYVSASVEIVARQIIRECREL